jgi:Protein of unknown function (DUF3105)
MKKLIWPLVIIAIVGVMVGLFALGNKTESDSQKNQTLLGTKHPEQARTHIKLTDQHEPYNSNPPSSGPHGGEPAKWGVSDQPIQDEVVIHNLEHGGIWIAYKPDLSSADVAQLKQIVANLPKSQNFNEVKVVMAPRAANTHAVELVAWIYTYDLDHVDEAKITQFYNDHMDKGPELVP